MGQVRYERNDVNRRVVVTVEGTFQAPDMITVIQRQRAEDCWAYGMLYDLRSATGCPTLEELRELMGKAAAHAPAGRPRGPVALLVTDLTSYGTLCTYASLGLSNLKVWVFRDFDDADRWLGAETAQGI